MQAEARFVKQHAIHPKEKIVVADEKLKATKKHLQTIVTSYKVHTSMPFQVKQSNVKY